jgi:hypothetical protein
VKLVVEAHPRGVELASHGDDDRILTSLDAEVELVHRCVALASRAREHT